MTKETLPGTLRKNQLNARTLDNHLGFQAFPKFQQPSPRFPQKCRFASDLRTMLQEIRKTHFQLRIVVHDLNRQTFNLVIDCNLQISKMPRKSLLGNIGVDIAQKEPSKTLQSPAEKKTDLGIGRYP